MAEINLNKIKGLVRGYVFESIVKILFERNNFEIIKEEGYGIKGDDNFIQLLGKGTYHQIDCPYYYPLASPFMNKLRLLGEVKFYKNPIDKSLVREAIGIMKDISEGQGFMRDLSALSREYVEPTTDIYVIISATGFQEEAWNLGVAHGIKMVSFDNNIIVANLKEYIFNLVEEINVQSILSQIGSFRTDLKNFLNSLSNHLIINYSLSTAAIKTIQNIKKELSKMKTNFWGFTKSQTLLCFISEFNFPFELLTDNVLICKLQSVYGSENLYSLHPVKNKELLFYFGFPTSRVSSSLVLHDELDRVYAQVKDENGEYRLVTLQWAVKDVKELPESSIITSYFFEEINPKSLPGEQ